MTRLLRNRWALLGEGSPGQIYRNVTSYVAGTGAGGFLDLWYASSFAPAVSLLKGETFPITSLFDSQIVDIALPIVTTFWRGTQLLIVLAAAIAWLRPEVVPPGRLVYFAIALALSSSEAGGYTQMLLLVFVFMEPWRGMGRKLALVLAYLMCIPAEFVIAEVPSMVRVSWLWDAGAPVIVEYGIGGVSLFRLIGTYVMTISLCCVTMRDVWNDVHFQGWRGRWRYRRDAPFLPFVQRPVLLGPADKS